MKHFQEDWEQVRLLQKLGTCRKKPSANMIAVKILVSWKKK